MSGLAVVRMSLMEASEATCGLIGRACGSALTALCQFGWPVTAGLWGLAQLAARLRDFF